MAGANAGFSMSGILISVYTLLFLRDTCELVIYKLYTCTSDWNSLTGLKSTLKRMNITRLYMYFRLKQPYRNKKYTQNRKIIRHTLNACLIIKYYL